MKRLITSALILALTIGAAQAQDATTGKHHNGVNKEEKMGFDKLNLTADQKTRLKPIRENFKKQMQDLSKQDQLTVAEMRNRRQALHQQFQSQVEAILTPAQKEQYAKIKADRKDGKGDFGGRKGFGNRGEGRFQKGGADLQKELNLTPDQQEKVAQIRSEYRSKFQALRSDNSLNQDQKKQKMHDLMEQQHNQMKQVLTPQQIQKLESLHKEKAAKNV